ncbi:Appr-1-p processing protein [Streptomyces sp. NPDC002092]
MSEIIHVRGDATVPSVKGVKVIAHVCGVAPPGAALSLWALRKAVVCTSCVAGRAVPRAPSGRGLRRTSPRAAPCGAMRTPSAGVVPRIGCVLAGGTWSRIEPLVTGRLVKRGVQVTVHDHGEAKVEP